MRIPVRALALLPAAMAVLPTSACAQVRASELASVSQTIDGTKITIQYSRPRARGRSPLFGGKVVKWDEVWTPGANWATTLDVSKDVTLEGHRVARGTYSVWMVVRKSGTWTVILDPKAKRYHMQPPDSSANQVRFAVHVQDAPFVEALTWSISELHAEGGSVAMQWGTTRVAMQLDVEPSLRTTLAAADAQPYLGRFDYSERGASGASGATAGTKALIVSYHNGTLKAEFDPADAMMRRFAMIRIAPDWFVPGLYDDNGEIYEVLRPDMVIEFARVNGRAETFDVRGDDDKVFASGKRIP